MVEVRDPHLGIAALFAVLFIMLRYGLIPILEPFPFLIPIPLFGFWLFGFLWIFHVVKALRSK
ncbi:MAG TPA: hypothetical protein VEK34_01020 [Methylocella sp.]|nr:hypothetical protein [Methylocella sp.]